MFGDFHVHTVHSFDGKMTMEEACAAAVKRALEQRTSEAERVSVGRAIREAYSIDGWVNAVLKCYESA